MDTIPLWWEIAKLLITLAISTGSIYISVKTIVSKYITGQAIENEHLKKNIERIDTDISLFRNKFLALQQQVNQLYQVEYPAIMQTMVKVQTEITMLKDLEQTKANVQIETNKIILAYIQAKDPKNL